MQTTIVKFPLLLVLTLLLIISACGPTDTVTVVQDAPRIALAETAEDDDVEEFRQITIGLIDPVTNLDPLFAENLSTKRAVSLIYESLFTLNEIGEPVPALADTVEISENGLEYTIHLKENIFFNDSRVFTAGVGRRLHANDVKRAFERTAVNTVPEHASRLLMNVVGYRSFFTEQRSQHDVTRRVVDGVRGIEVLNQRSLVIRLNQPDELLLEKLASPYLSIYPQESVSTTGFSLTSNPVGTGPFRFRSMENGRIILSKNEHDRFQDFGINRIDLVFKGTESELFQEFIRSNIDWIPEAGPLINRQVLDADGLLRSSYEDDFTLINNAGFRFTAVYINQYASAETAWLADRLRNSNEVNFRLNGTLDFRPELLPDDEPGEPKPEYFITNTENLTARVIFSEINSALVQPESSLSYLDIYVVIPEITLYSRTTDNVHIRNKDLSGFWLSFETPVISLHSKRLSGIEPSAVPWLLTVRNLQLQNAGRQPS